VGLFGARTAVPTERDFALTNSGVSALHPSDVAISGLDASSFDVASNTCTGTLNPGATCDIVVVYDPPSENSSDTAVLTFSDELAPLGAANGPNGLGSGSHILLEGNLFHGYLLAYSSGDVEIFGNLTYQGNIYHRPHNPIVGATSTPDENGYWLVASDGGIFSFGDASFYGSTGAIHLNKPVVGMASTPDGHGYWLVASDGGIFSFGDASFYGSTGAIHLNKPVVGMASTPDGHGYWLVASDGGIFSFGDAGFHGSTGAIHLNKPIVGMASTADGQGYWLAASDGGVFSFGDAEYFGGTASGGQQDAVAVSPLFPA